MAKNHLLLFLSILVMPEGSFSSVHLMYLPIPWQKKVHAFQKLTIQESSSKNYIINETLTYKVSYL